MEASKALAEHLKRYHRASRKTYQQLADELGVGKTTLYKLEQGTGSFSSATLDQISARLGVRPADLLAGDDGTIDLIAATARSFAQLSEQACAQAIHHFAQLIAVLRTGQDG